MDEFDRASEIEQRDRDRALTVRKPTLKQVGLCHYCSSPIASSLLFCGKDCADDWQRLDAAKQRNGGF